MLEGEPFGNTLTLGWLAQRFLLDCASLLYVDHRDRLDDKIETERKEEQFEVLGEQTKKCEQICSVI